MRPLWSATALMEQRSDVALTGSLVLAMGAGPVVVAICSATGPLLIDQFGLSNAEFGRLSSTAFVSAALASAVLGRVVDRIAPLAGVLCLQGLSAATLLLIGLTPSLQTLTLGLALSGLVQALGNPVTNRIVAIGF